MTTGAGRVAGQLTVNNDFNRATADPVYHEHSAIDRINSAPAELSKADAVKRH